MKVLFKSIFLALAVTIIGYSAIEAGAPSMFSAHARTCCTYQIDCAESETCKEIEPDCSESYPHICKSDLD